MEQKKPWWKSKTIWGAALTGVVGVANAAGYPVSPALVDGVGPLIDLALLAAGTGLAVHGRATAASAIGK
ncbi:MAG TPA: hypothetical protein PKZ97_16575 [Azospirillaceae bacterium]|nr:hypothetical protein [Azospirillaceae bacterium]